MANKRTYINADEELIVQGRLIIEGNIEQRQYTNTVTYSETKFEGETFIINSDGFDKDNVATDATLKLRSGAGYGVLTYQSSTNKLVIDKTIVAPTVEANLTGTATAADSLSSPFSVQVSGAVSSTTYNLQNAGDSVNIATVFSPTGVTAGNYGTASAVSTFTVNAGGQLTSASNTTIDIASSQVNDLETVVEGFFSANDTGGDGSFSYANGVYTYTGPSAAETRAHFTGGTGITYSSSTGDISITDNVLGDAPGTYGDATHVSRTQVNSRGQVTAISEVEINIPHNQITDFDSASRALLSVNDTGGDGSLAYNSTTGLFTYTGPSASEVRAHISVDDTAGNDGSLSYNSSTGVITFVGTSAAETRAHISVTDNGGDGSLGYNSATGVISYTGPSLAQVQARIDNSASNVRAHFSGGDGIDLASGVIDVDTSVVRTTGNQSIAGTKTFTGSVDLSSATVPGFTVTGDLNVTGEFNSLTQVDLLVEDTSITMRSGAAGNGDAHIYVVATSDNPYLKWDTGSSRWQFSNDGSTDKDILLLTDFSASSGINYNSSTGAFTADNSEIRSLVSVSDGGGDGSLSYDAPTGVITYTGPSPAEVRAHISSNNVSGDGSISYNSTSGIISYTGPSAAESRAHFSVTDSGGDGSLAYNSTTGVFTYTGPSLAEVQARIDNSASNVRAHLSASNGVGYNSSTGAFQAVESEIQHDSLDGFVANEHVDHSAVDITAGSGLTGGGDITTSRTLNVIGGDGITANANDIEVDSTVIRTTGDQSLAGEKTFTGKLILPSTDVTDAGAIFTDANEAWVYVNGTKKQITPAGSVGYVEESSSGQTYANPGITGSSTHELYSGQRSSGGNLYHGIKGINDGTYTTITSDTNTVSIDADISAIRGAFSASGDLSYNSTTGAFSFTNDAGDIESVTAGTGLTGGGTSGAVTLNADQSYIRGSISASGLVSYNSTTGALTTTADNYTSWSVQTESGSGASAPITSGDSLILTGGTNITVTNVGDTVTISNDNTADITGVAAGSGLTGGGNTGAVTLNIGTGSGISVAADSISTDDTYIRGLFTGSSGVNYNSTTGAITADQSEVRGLISAGGDLAYNSTTGVVSFTERTDAEVRGLISASGDISYNSTTGVVSFSAAAAPVTSVNSLTGAVVLDTGDIGENGPLYHTTARARGAISASGDISYNSTTGVISYTTPTERTDAEVRGLISAGGDLAYNSTTGVMSYTTPTERTDGEVRGLISVTDTGGHGSLTYNSTTGVITYTGPSASDIRGDISSSTGISYNQVTGAISTNDSQIVHDNLSGFVANEHVDHSSVSITAGNGLTGGGDITTSRTINVVGGTGITVNANDIEVNQSEIRGLFSASGDISYNSTTGVFSFTDSDTVGTVTSVSVGTGLDVSNGTTTPSISLDLSDLTDMTAAVVGTEDELILLDNGAERRKRISEITLSDFNNDLGNYGGWTSNVGDITGVTAGSGLTGGGSSGGVTLNIGAGSYMTVNADDIAVDATSANTANKVVARDGSGNFSAGVITATATAARYADLAEMYTADASYDPGTVVIVGGEAEVTVTDNPGSYKVAGVVSTDPAYLMNAESQGVAVALRGRVPCKVVGNVNKGDVLVTSDLPGHAMVGAMPHSLSPLQIIGIALETKTEAAPGIIEVLV